MSEIDDIWTERIPLETVAGQVQRALAEGLIDDRTPAAVFHDLEGLRRRYQALSNAFPPSTLHAIAVKANPLVNLLKELVALGAGLEAASVEEIHLAEAAGCPPDRIVFDSPAKTRTDLAWALKKGIRINADSFDELERIRGLISSEPEVPPVGLRINPRVAEGRIKTTSVGGARARFGVAIADDVDAMAARIAEISFVTGLHVHVGSQGCTMPSLVDAVERVSALADRIDHYAGTPRITWLDVGGGLPVTYRAEQPAFGVAAYTSQLKARLPHLFSQRVLVTELGRAIQVPAGWAVSRVEYVKTVAGIPVAAIHLGADFMVRTAYRPDDWYHEVNVLDAAGRPKTGPHRPHTLAGPLCFAGDVLAEDRLLPDIVPGDHIVLHDTGGYTMSMWSRHCSRGMPPVYGYHEEGFTLLKAKETPQDVVRLWS